MRTEPSLRSIRCRNVISFWLTLGRLPSTTSGPWPRFAAADWKPRKNLGLTTVPPVRPLSSSGTAWARFGSRSSVSPRFAARLHAATEPAATSRMTAPASTASRRGRSTLTATWCHVRRLAPEEICKKTKEAAGRRQRRSAHALPSRRHRRSRRSLRRGFARARRGQPGPRDRGAAGLAALEGDVLRQDRRARRADDGEGPARVPARRPTAGDGGAGASNARTARSARPAADCAPRARTGNLRLGRLVAAVPARASRTPAPARRRRPLRRLDQGRTAPLSAHARTFTGRDRRPRDPDGLRSRAPHAGADEGDEVDHDQLRRASRATRSPRSPPSTRRPCARSPPPTTSSR